MPARLQIFNPPFLIYILCFSLSHGVPGIIPLLPTFQAEFHLNSLEVSNCIAFFSYSALFATPFIGYIYSKIPKRIFICLVNGIYFLGMIGTSLSPDYTVLLCFRIIQGIGSAGISLLMTILPPEYYRGMKRARIVGKSHAVIALGLFCNPFVSGYIALYSWRMSVLFLTVPTIFTLLTLIFTNLTEKYDIKQTNFSFFQIREILANPATCILLFILFIVSGIDLSVPSIFSLFTADVHGYNSSAIGIIYAFGNIGMFIGSSWLLTKYLKTKYFLYILAGLCLVVSSLLFTFTSLEKYSFVLTFFLYYCLSGTLVPFVNFSISNCIPAPLLTLGLTISMTCFRAGQGIITAFFAGINNEFGYQTAFSYMAGFYILAIICIAIYIRKYTKKRI